MVALEATVDGGVLPSAAFNVKRATTYFRERGPEVSSVPFDDVEGVSSLGRG